MVKDYGVTAIKSAFVLKGVPEGSSVVIPRLFCRDIAAAIVIMIEGEWPGMATRAPKPDGSSPVVTFVYVEDVDKTVERAVAGAKVLFPVENQLWGDRSGWVIDPSGHVWTIATRVQETSEDQTRERWSTILSAKS